MDAGAPHTGYPHRLPRPCDNGDGRSVPERQETMRATRKRRLPALLAAVLIFALAAGCVGPDDGENDGLRQAAFRQAHLRREHPVLLGRDNQRQLSPSG